MDARQSFDNPPPSHETDASQITIRSYTPAELNALDPAVKEKLDLPTIVSQALQIEDADKINEFTQKMFFDEQEGKKVFIAEKDGKAVGYVNIKILKQGVGDHAWIGDSGQSFLADVSAIAKDHSLLEAIETSSESILAVWGVATRTENRKQSIQKKLWQKVQAELQPEVVIGHSKNPDAVMSRTKTFGDGYRTFFGPTDVTQNAEGETITETPNVRALRIAALNLYASDLEGPDRTDRILAHRSHIISSPLDAADRTMPNTEGFPNGIQKAFAPLIEQQEKFPEKLLLLPLISVKDNLVGEPSTEPERPARRRMSAPEER